MVTITVKGRVFRGKGEGGWFISLSWVKKQFKEKLGFNPYPGTLNLRLPGKAEIRNLKRMVNLFRGIEIGSAEEICRGRCFKALIMEKVNGAVVIPNIPNYPTDVLEVVAGLCLRDRFNLRDGDEVELTVWLE